MTSGVREVKMRAARIVEPGRIEIERVAVPTPGPRQVRIRLEGCGVCASNLGPWQGLPWLEYPMAPGDGGHEGWGIVDAVGRDVRSVGVGDRVAAVSYKAYAEYDVADENAVFKLPEALAAQPFPGEALACAMNIFRRSDVAPGQTIAVVGVGFLGALSIRLASAAGARVIGISRRPFSLDLARRMGAAETIPMEDHHGIVERVGEMTGGRFCERVIEAVGKQWPLDLAAELTGERGRLIVAGYHQDGPRQVNMQLWNWRGFDVINAHERETAVYLDGMQRAVAEVGSGRLDPAPVLTHRFALDRLGDALDAVRDRPAGFVKAWIAPAEGAV